MFDSQTFLAQVTPECLPCESGCELNVYCNDTCINVHVYIYIYIVVFFMETCILFARIPKQDTSSAVERTLQNLFHKSGDTVSHMLLACPVLFLSIFSFFPSFFLCFFLCFLFSCFHFCLSSFLFFT